MRSSTHAAVRSFREGSKSFDGARGQPYGRVVRRSSFDASRGKARQAAQGTSRDSWQRHPLGRGRGSRRGVTPRLHSTEDETETGRKVGCSRRAASGAVFAAAVETTVTAILHNPLAYPRVKGEIGEPSSVGFRTPSSSAPPKTRSSSWLSRRRPAPTTLALASLSLTSGWSGAALPAARAVRVRPKR